MSSDKLRRQVACDAARLMYEREETEYFRAKLKAARRLTRGDFKPSDLPSNREIRDQIQVWRNSRRASSGRTTSATCAWRPCA